MATRLAVFGGVYSNHAALDAVLADVARHGAELVHGLGDLGGFGPAPDRAIELLRHSGVPWLRGNVDDSVAHRRDDCACGYTDPRDDHFSRVSFDYTTAHTSDAHRAWLATLPEQRRLEIEGRRVLLCHGSPRRVNEFLWESTCSDAFLAWLCDTHDADVIVCSHTGLPWHRELPDGRHVVNAGAIGRPANDGCPLARHACLTFGEGVTASTTIAPFSASIVMTSPRAISLRRIISATGASTRRAIARRIGRAPSSGS